jgi:hypothetical protein
MIEQDLIVPADVSMVTVELTRRPTLRFDRRIAGTAWVDDVSFKKVQ